jgi:hypothetical protein
MPEQHAPKPIFFRPQLDSPGGDAVLSFARALDAADTDRGQALEEALERADEALVARAALHVLHDLAAQGWRVAARDDVVEIRPLGVDVDLTQDLKGRPLISPQEKELRRAQAKQRIKTQEHLARDEQLRTPSAVRFIKGMERSQMRGGLRGSIFDLMRDGRALAADLRSARALTGDARAAALAAAVDPYLEFVDDRATCGHTGLRLMDVWRYFRHTWANQYVSVPGRSMMFLIRDRAADKHPVMGIGAVSSAAVQIDKRDRFIGWHPDELLRAARAAPSDALAAWFVDTLDAAVAEIYVDDLVAPSPGGAAPNEAVAAFLARADLESPAFPPESWSALRDAERDALEQLAQQALGARPLCPADLDAPSIEAIEQLRMLARIHRHYHRGHDDRETLKGAAAKSAGDWRAQAQTHLFGYKRAAALADLLEARLEAQRFLGDAPDAAGLAELLKDAAGRAAFLKVARKAKADRVGVAIADISVCGAIPPYNPLLGGKLAAMLAASPEVAAAYKARYGAAVSDIASKVAGREVVRPADLVFLGTTSLFGRSSQYNRLRVPAARLGGAADDALRFTPLGDSEGFGSSHFSAETQEALRQLLQSEGKDFVNNLFGEGTSPKLRRLRDGLALLGFESKYVNALLNHGRKREVFGVSLITNLRDYLIGLDDAPRYRFDVDAPPKDATAAVAAWWRERWLSKRIERDEALEDAAKDRLVRPIRHRACVDLPEDEEEEGVLDLFGDE